METTPSSTPSIDPKTICRIETYIISHSTFKPTHRQSYCTPEYSDAELAQTGKRTTRVNTSHINDIVTSMNKHPELVSFAGDWTGNREYAMELDGYVAVAFNY